VGPGGFGTEHWISPDQTFHYTVRFENDAQKATAPAQIVRITQQLSTNLDLRTFRLGVMGFGTNLVDVPADRVFYQTQVNVTNDLGVVVEIVAGLDLAKGEVTWEFTSIDPATGEQPWDPYVGFLPPNTNGVIGQGFVSYIIKPKADIFSGDIINAEARIFFDYNEPMDTPHVFNTVDADVPSSRVLPLPNVSSDRAFRVEWDGTDVHGGAGIQGFDIYVSADGGPWRPWLQSTPYTERIFVGENGHSYGFYSVARDNVGHAEPSPATADASISVLTPFTLRVTAAAYSSAILLGSEFTHGLVVTNEGPGNATNVVLTYAIDPAFEILAAATSQGVVHLADSLVTAQLGQLLPNSHADVAVRLRALAAGSATNRVAVASDQGFGDQAEFHSTVLNMPPSLSLAVTEAGLTLTWPTTAVGFVLEQTENLSPSTWTPVADPPSVEGDLNGLILVPSRTTMFYRLVRR
jgi:hypothetical protein